MHSQVSIGGSEVVKAEGDIRVVKPESPFPDFECLLKYGY
jgi:hypothetical protein